MQTSLFFSPALVRIDVAVVVFSVAVLLNHLTFHLECPHLSFIRSALFYSIMKCKQNLWAMSDLIRTMHGSNKIRTKALNMKQDEKKKMISEILWNKNNEIRIPLICM